MKYLSFLLLLSLCSCGGKYDVSGDVNVSGVVEHKIEFTDLDNYFATQCQTKIVGDFCYSSDIPTCTNCLLVDFISKT